MENPLLTIVQAFMGIPNIASCSYSLPEQIYRFLLAALSLFSALLTFLTSVFIRISLIECPCHLQCKWELAKRCNELETLVSKPSQGWSREANEGEFQTKESACFEGKMKNSDEVLQVSRNCGGGSKFLHPEGIWSEESLNGDCDDDILVLRRALENERAVNDQLRRELEEEQSAAESAARASMALMAKIQEEKALVCMEATQKARIASEKMMYDEEAIKLMNMIIAKQEIELLALEKEVAIGRAKLLAAVSSPSDDSPMPTGSPLGPIDFAHSSVDRETMEPDWLPECAADLMGTFGEIALFDNAAFDVDGESTTDMDRCSVKSEEEGIAFVGDENLRGFYADVGFGESLEMQSNSSSASNEGTFVSFSGNQGDDSMHDELMKLRRASRDGSINEVSGERIISMDSASGRKSKDIVAVVKLVTSEPEIGVSADSGDVEKREDRYDGEAVRACDLTGLCEEVKVIMDGEVSSGEAEFKAEDVFTQKNVVVELSRAKIEDGAGEGVREGEGQSAVMELCRGSMDGLVVARQRTEAELVQEVEEEFVDVHSTMGLPVGEKDAIEHPDGENEDGVDEMGVGAELLDEGTGEREKLHKPSKVRLPLSDANVQQFGVLFKNEHAEMQPVELLTFVNVEKPKVNAKHVEANNSGDTVDKNGIEAPKSFREDGNYCLEKPVEDQFEVQNQPGNLLRDKPMGLECALTEKSTSNKLQRESGFVRTGGGSILSLVQKFEFEAAKAQANRYISDRGRERNKFGPGGRVPSSVSKPLKTSSLESNVANSETDHGGVRKGETEKHIRRFVAWERQKYDSGQENSKIETEKEQRNEGFVKEKEDAGGTSLVRPWQRPSVQGLAWRGLPGNKCGVREEVKVDGCDYERRTLDCKREEGDLQTETSTADSMQSTDMDARCQREIGGGIEIVQDERIMGVAAEFEANGRTPPLDGQRDGEESISFKGSQVGGETSGPLPSRFSVSSNTTSKDGIGRGRIRKFHEPFKGDGLGNGGGQLEWHSETSSVCEGGSKGSQGGGEGSDLLLSRFSVSLNSTSKDGIGRGRIIKFHDPFEDDGRVNGGGHLELHSETSSVCGRGGEGGGGGGGEGREWSRERGVTSFQRTESQPEQVLVRRRRALIPTTSMLERDLSQLALKKEINDLTDQLMGVESQRQDRNRSFQELRMACSRFEEGGT